MDFRHLGDFSQKYSEFSKDRNLRGEEPITTRQTAANYPSLLNQATQFHIRRNIMFKKLTLAAAAVLVIGGVLFGTNMVTYMQAAFDNARQAGQDLVSVEFQLEAAEKQLAKIEPQIYDMIHQAAKEKAEIKRLAAEVNRQNEALDKSKDEMLTLRSHMDSGDQVYVATNGKAYTNDRVEEDLRHRFSLHKTTTQTRDKSAQILELRAQALASALVKIDDARALQRELEVQIESLNARNRMVEVAQTASNLNIDDSQLARTQEMLDDISARIDTDEEMLAMAPEYLGQIPVSQDSVLSTDGNIVDEIDAFFDASDDADDETDYVSN